MTGTFAILAVTLSLLVSGATAVDYVRLSPPEFAADLQKGSRLLDERRLH